MSKRLVISYKTYDFTNDNGKRLFGAKLQYINKRNSSKDNIEGNPVMIIDVKGEDLLKKLKGAPAIYDIETYEEADKNNKPVTYIEELEHISDIDFAQFF